MSTSSNDGFVYTAGSLFQIKFPDTLLETDRVTIPDLTVPNDQFLQYTFPVYYTPLTPLKRGTSYTRLSHSYSKKHKDSLISLRCIRNGTTL